MISFSSAHTKSLSLKRLFISYFHFFKREVSEQQAEKNVPSNDDNTKMPLKHIDEGGQKLSTTFGSWEMEGLEFASFFFPFLCPPHSRIAVSF